MKTRPSECKDSLLSRYFDKTTTKEENLWVEAHLKTCLRCRKMMGDYSGLSRIIKQRVDREAQQADFLRVEKNVLLKTSNKNAYNVSGSFFSPRRLLIPVAVTVFLVAITTVFYPFKQKTPVSSAIIDSFSGETASVMIFEVPESGQTIIWYSENSEQMGDDNAI